MLRVLFRNAASNWFGFAVHAAIAFFLTPFVLESLGDARYGVWALVTGLTGYYGLLDLGFRSGINFYMTRYLATRDFDQLNRIASTAFLGLLAIGGLILSTSLVLAYCAPLIFKIPTNALGEARCCFLIIGGSVAIQFLLFPFSAAFVAAQRYDITSVIGISTRLMGAAATLALLKAGFGLIGLSLVTAAVELAGYLLRWRIAYRIIPELMVSPRLARWKALREVALLSGWFVLIEGANMLIYSSDAVVIGMFLPVAAIAPFALAISVNECYARIFRPIGMVFCPAAIHLHARGEEDQLRTIYLTGTKLFLLVAIATGMIGWLWAPDFFRLWVADRLKEAAGYPPPESLFRVLVVGAVAIASQRIGYQVLLGMQRQKNLCILLVAEGLVNLLLSVCLIRPLGLLGVALGTTIPAILFQVFLVPRELLRALKLSTGVYLSRVWGRVFVATLPLVLMLAAIRYASPVATGWHELILQGFCATGSSFLLLLLLGLNQDERARLLSGPVAHLLRALSRSRLEAPAAGASDPPAAGGSESR